MIDTTENITFHQTTYAGGKNISEPKNTADERWMIPFTQVKNHISCGICPSKIAQSLEHSQVITTSIALSFPRWSMKGRYLWSNEQLQKWTCHVWCKMLSKQYWFLSYLLTTISMNKICFLRNDSKVQRWIALQFCSQITNWLVLEKNTVRITDNPHEISSSCLCRSACQFLSCFIVTDRRDPPIPLTGQVARSVADPGFPRGGGANPQGGGANLLFGQKFPENGMKMKEFGLRGGVRPWRPPPLDPPM